MNLDKDTLVKNRFWILVGTAAAFTLVGWLLLLFLVPTTVAKDQADVAKTWKIGKNFQQGPFVTPESVRAKQEEATKLEHEYSKIHQELYNTQKAQAKFLMTWPRSMVARGFDISNGKYALDVAIQPDSKAGAKKLESMPPDTEKQISGTLTGETDADWFKVMDRKGNTIQFQRTNNTKISDQGKPLPFGELSKKAQRHATVTFSVGKWFGEDLTEAEIRAFKDTYAEQLPDVIKELEPVNYLNETEVMLRYTITTKSVRTKRAEVSNEAWIYQPGKFPPPDNRFFSYVPEWNNDVRKILSEEVWTAQENLWIDRELYKQIRLINQSVGHCERVKSPAPAAAKSGEDAPGKDDKDGWVKYRNFYWEIALKEMGGKFEVQLRNLRPRSQNINNLRFLLRFKDPNDKSGQLPDPVVFPPREPRDLRFEGGAVSAFDPEGSSGRDKFPTKGTVSFAVRGSLANLQSVDQILTVDTAAVKRLDVLTIVQSADFGDMALSHKLAKTPALRAFRKKAPPPAPTKSKAPTGDDNPVEAKIKDAPPPPPNGPDQDDVAADAKNIEGIKVDLSKFSPHKLLLDRYLAGADDFTTAYRKVPVAITMVVGPEHLNRVEAGLTSSPLRFLPGQVIWQRCQLSLSSPPQPGLKTKTPAPSAASSGGDSQENIELSIYGVITIYDRPNRPPDAPPRKR